MTRVRVYTREVTIQIDTPMKALIPSFDPIKDAPNRLPRMQLGERFSFDVLLPNGYDIEDRVEAGRKYVSAPDGNRLDVIDVWTKACLGVDGFRLATAPRD